ncbi:hypothetical protein EON65_00840 [archaeon]|nr:MAG: hypothetical protein EON65_00840 [archaeon]
MSEEHVFILDIGSSSVKGGYSGEDSPSYVFPSTLTKAPRTVEVCLFQMHIMFHCIQN